MVKMVRGRTDGWSSAKTVSLLSQYMLCILLGYLLKKKHSRMRFFPNNVYRVHVSLLPTHFNLRTFYFRRYFDSVF